MNNVTNMVDLVTSHLPNEEWKLMFLFKHYLKLRDASEGRLQQDYENIVNQIAFLLPREANIVDANFNRIESQDMSEVVINNLPIIVNELEFLKTHYHILQQSCRAGSDLHKNYGKIINFISNVINALVSPIQTVLPSVSSQDGWASVNESYNIPTDQVFASNYFLPGYVNNTEMMPSVSQQSFSNYPQQIPTFNTGAINFSDTLNMPATASVYPITYNYMENVPQNSSFFNNQANAGMIQPGLQQYPSAPPISTFGSSRRCLFIN